jgi:ketosteroid isomerase-like protein
MARLTEDAIRTIEEIHARWIAAEIAGDLQSCLNLCAEEIELWAPDQAPAVGRAAVARKLTAETVKVSAVDISGTKAAQATMRFQAKDGEAIPGVFGIRTVHADAAQ